VTPRSWDARQALQIARRVPLYFEKAVLSGAIFNRSDLRGCGFYGSDLSKCDLFQADMKDCDLKLANIRGATLNRCNLEGAITWRIKYDRATQFSYVDTSKTDWSYNPQLKQDITLYQKKEQLKAEFPVIHFFWWLFGDCGRSLARVILRVIVIAAAFGVLYSFPISDASDIGYYRRYLSPILYSFSSLLGLGYEPSFCVSEITQVLTTVEGTIGYVMLAVLIAVFLSKVKD
jgi:hypothetical protein